MIRFTICKCSRQLIYCALAIWFGSYGVDCFALSFSTRPVVTNYDYAVEQGAWCGKAMCERASVVDIESPWFEYPSVSSQEAFFWSLKWALPSLSYYFANYNVSTAGSFDVWFSNYVGSASIPQYPYNEEDIAAAFGLPTNFFWSSPWRPDPSDILGWSGINTALNALRWTSAYPDRGDIYYYGGGACGSTYPAQYPTWTFLFTNNPYCLSSISIRSVYNHRLCNVVKFDIYATNIAHGVSWYMTADAPSGYPFMDFDNMGFSENQTHSYGGEAVGIYTQRICSLSRVTTCPSSISGDQYCDFTLQPQILLRWDVAGGFTYIDNAP